MLSFLYTIGYMKNNSHLFKLWCWLAYKKIYHILQIPSHYIKGFWYKYNLKQITYFCLGIIKEKIYKQQFKIKEVTNINYG